MRFWRHIDTCPIDRPVLVCWLDEGEYDRIVYIHMCADHKTFMNLNSNNINHFKPDQPHAWPHYWRDVPAPPFPKLLSESSQRKRRG